MATLRLQGEGGYHPRKQTSNPRHPSVDFYHSPVAVWVNSAPQPKRWGPRAYRGMIMMDIFMPISNSKEIWLYSPRYYKVITTQISYMSYHTSWKLLQRFAGQEWNYINSLWPSVAIWQHRSEWTLAQVMACCLTAPSHYLNQCWLIIEEVLWQ